MFHCNLNEFEIDMFTIYLMHDKYLFVRQTGYEYKVSSAEWPSQVSEVKDTTVYKIINCYIQFTKYV